MPAGGVPTALRNRVKRMMCFSSRQPMTDGPDDPLAGMQGADADQR